MLVVKYCPVTVRRTCKPPVKELVGQSIVALPESAQPETSVMIGWLGYE
jgi:hypothetical protein